MLQLLFVLRAKRLDSLNVQATEDLLLSLFSCTMTRVEYRASLLSPLRILWRQWVMVIGETCPINVLKIMSPRPPLVWSPPPNPEPLRGGNE